MKREFESLVKKAMRDDQAAFAEICSQKGKSILYYCIKLTGSVQDGEDAAQEVLIRMHSRLHTLKSAKAFNAWLQNLTFNICYDMRRKSMKTRDALTTEDEFWELVGDDSLEALPQHVVEQTEVRRRILDVIENLPEHYRVAVQLYYYEEMSYQEIAKVLDASPAAVSSYLQRAKKVLRIKLDDILQEPDAKKPARLLAIGPAIRWVLDEAIEAAVPNAMLEKCLLAAGAARAAAIAGGGAATAAGAAASAGVFKIVVAIVAVSVGVGLTSLAAGKIIPTLSASSSTGAAIDYIAPQGTAESLPVEDGVDDIETILEAKSTHTLSVRVTVKQPGNADPNARDGLEGVALELVDADKPDRAVATTQTLGGVNHGIYLFAGFPPGRYRVRVQLPQGARVDEASPAACREGYLLLKENDVFDFTGSEAAGTPLALENPALVLEFPAVLQGQVRLATAAGAAIDGGEAYLPHITAQLLDPQQRVVDTTQVDETGAYLFTNAPVSQTGTYTIRFSMEDTKGVHITVDSMALRLGPGQSRKLNDCPITDAAPPMMSVTLLDGSCECNHTDPGRIEVTVNDTTPTTVTWRFLNADTGAVALQGSGADDLLHAATRLKSGEYTLHVTATDLAGNTTQEECLVAVGREE